MNKHDKENLRFLLSLSNKEICAWYETITEDEAEYALEILKQANLELAMQLASLHDVVEDVTDAKIVLNRFTLKGNTK
jgi:hypothetical protein